MRVVFELKGAETVGLFEPFTTRVLKVLKDNTILLTDLNEQKIWIFNSLGKG